MEKDGEESLISLPVHEMIVPMDGVKTLTLMLVTVMCSLIKLTLFSFPLMV